ncbi:hypothetical protein KM043_016294 [Ampulex compressa]|nr:hypothetical protein KM043_016294 [Ampulex compressa]
MHAILFETISDRATAKVASKLPRRHLEYRVTARVSGRARSRSSGKTVSLRRGMVEEEGAEIRGMVGDSSENPPVLSHGIASSRLASTKFTCSSSSSLSISVFFAFVCIKASTKRAASKL